jgi:hypothetical protein
MKATPGGKVLTEVGPRSQTNRDNDPSHRCVGFEGKDGCLNCVGLLMERSCKRGNEGPLFFQTFAITHSLIELRSGI